MGWLSERYPAISQLIAENLIPEFDNLYLDMNGIIHNCTHKDSDDATFRLGEDEMFIRIFNYIEHLFGKIKPKKLFFMAIDGVAPRAKMNQQRARRFRTALDAEKAREKAIREGVTLPSDDPFDSNCITPGTEFMAKLTKQLKYFINKKVSEDKDWQGCDIVLSGHEVPGEGEHKIMEYIRNAKAQPDYDPNVRHCLYGLDADLIMLGLVSHDPHFCLLREEVTFGRASKTKSKELEHQNFYLMHLCIVREYLELEFQDLKKDGIMKFPFDMEKIIDDFILMGFFVGNDFLPNLPYLHINEGALATMFRIYKEILPRCDGYINEGGVINFQRLGLLLDELAKEESRHFEHEHSDTKWLRSKQSADTNGASSAKAKSKGKMTMTSSQKELWKKIKKYVQKRPPGPLNLGSELIAADRKFVQDTADDFHLSWTTEVDDDGRRSIVLAAPPKADDEEDEEEDESHLAVMRVMKRYENAQVVDVAADEAQAAAEAKYKEKFLEWKEKYYSSKFEWTPANKEDELRKLCENYVQGLQWVLYYYYRGVASWPWFYQYHYSPMTSDVMKGINADLNFKLGQPFRPYEQLMGVLPDRSKKIVPTVYHELMTDAKSPIIDFYPRDFELDMNGKKMEWEAVVKIPFIEEERLLAAMASKNELLSAEEKARNDFGVSLKFTYDPRVDFFYHSSMAGVFPDIPNCHCVENIYDLPTAEGLELYRGLMEGTKLNIEALAGFPSLATLPYNATLGFHGVNVFQQDSRNESMVVTLEDVDMRSRIESAKVKLGQRCHVGYPFLHEAKVIRVSDELFDYTLAEDGSGRIVVWEHTGREIDEWGRTASREENFYSKRLGIIIGNVESMVHVELLKGLIKTDEGATIKQYGDKPSMKQVYPTQTIVDEVISQDERFIEKAALPIEEEFPIGSRAFFLGEFNYGRPLEIIGHSNNKVEITISTIAKEREFTQAIIRNAERLNRYQPSFAVAKDLGLHPLVLSKITSSFFVHTIGGSMKVNLGLNLKFEGRKQKVLGFSRKSASGWEFSPAAIGLITQYMINFPDFFAAIQRNPQGSEFSESDLFSPPDYASKRVKEIGAWLKTVETSKFERVPLDAEQLDSEVVKALEQEADRLLQEAGSPEPKTMKGVPRNGLIRPQDAEQRLGHQKFALGDRVVYIQDSGKVPIAMRGTVVGISTVGNNHMLDVVFDYGFMSGSSLGERCSPFRGLTVQANSVLNTTNKQLVAMSKTSVQRKPPGPNPRMSMGVGRTLYHDASAPAPLQGSWRGAVNGGNDQAGGYANAPHLQASNLVYRPAPNGHHANGPTHFNNRGGGSFRGEGGRGRGDGGRNRGDRGRGRGGRGGGGAAAGAATPSQPPVEIAYHTQQQSQPGYHSVPPPPSLTVRGRGRGRGPRGGSGRGGRGRGGSQQNQ